MRTTEIYFMNAENDRDYFVDKFRGEPLGISEQFGITLKERPSIPTAELRYDTNKIQGMAGDHATEDDYENVEIILAFNYINSEANARETYNAVSNYLATMKPGIRVRFSDDTDGTFRVLARKPLIEELNNDLYNWGDFEIILILKPFRYIEEKELNISTNSEIKLKQPLPNAMNIPQRITHYTERNVNIETYKNGNKVYTINSSTFNKNRIITDAELLYTYGGD